MIKLYGHELSGNSYKVRLLLELLKVDYEWIKIDLMQGEHKSSAYLALNPFGQVPTLVDGDTVLADSQAILVYLAQQYGDQQWLPIAPLALAQVIRWLSISAGEVVQGPGNARLYYLFGVSSINIERAQERSNLILTQLNQHLQTHTWLEFEHPTIADIAVFPYVALARDGKVDLDAYPHILSWIERVKQLPNYIPMAGI
ncbi:MAG: glutathione S-transferase family protein [Symploca sp. SIO2C1]|nr:glutathione S-transferase family protein [Symploca sp. SIO2C1]